jgi:hypothetical protein
MSFTDKIIEAILLDDSSFVMTIEDVKQSTVQELLLYYAYTKIVNKKFRFNFDMISSTTVDDITQFKENHDILSIAFCLSEWSKSIVSQKTKDEIIEYSILYGLLSDKNIQLLFVRFDIKNSKGNIYIKHSVLNAHGVNNVKSARNV